MRQDDSSNLQSLLDLGKSIPPGWYILDRRLVVRRDYTVIENCSFEIRHGGPYLEFSNVSNCVIRNCEFRGIHGLTV